MRFTTIAIDPATREKLKARAGGRGVATLIRKWANDPEPEYLAEVEALRASILRQLQDIKDDVASIKRDMAEFDNVWWRSFLKHEKDVLKIGVQMGLLRSAIQHFHQDEPDAEDLEQLIVEQAVEESEKRWIAHAEKNGIPEELWPE